MKGMEMLYKDEMWLRSQYSKLQKSSCMIAKEHGCSNTTVMYWLRKFKVPIRSRSETTCIAQSNHISISKTALEFLNGSLLGDGHLELQRMSAAVTYSSKYEGYLKWISKKVAQFGIEQSGAINKYEGWVMFPGGKKHYGTFFRYGSRHYVELKELQSKWYRPATQEERERGRKFFKIIPTGLELTPLTCQQWFLDDGKISRRGKDIGFSTQGFSDGEILFLISLLADLGLKTTTNKNREIYVSRRSKKDFLNYIGPCPQEIKSIYGYKWDGM